MELLTLLALTLGIHFFDLPAKAEKVRDIWRFIGEFPEWLNYHKKLEEKVKTLNRKKENLSCLEEDVNNILEHAELQHGKKRKREVENWFRDVQCKKDDCVSVEQQIREGRYFLRPWLERRVEKTIQEVDELYDGGKFPEELLLNAHITSREPLQTAMLVGDVSTTVIERVWQCLDGNEVSRIGIHGAEGVGKTAIMMHIHNRILESSSTFEHVFWVTASQHSSIHDLQDAIAKQVGMHPLNEEDMRKRAAKLFRALRSKKGVLILDDISNPLKPDEIGIPYHAVGCKLILSTRSLKVCRMMDCQEIIEVKPLSDEEAVTLFKEKVHLGNDIVPIVEEIARLIVKNCEGLPLLIIDVAQRLRGVDDINEWMDALTAAREFKRGLTD